MVKVKLTIRENGNLSAKWWRNFISYHRFDNEKECRLKLREDNIKICVRGESQHTAWLEFQSEQDRDWFLLKWT